MALLTALVGLMLTGCSGNRSATTGARAPQTVGARTNAPALTVNPVAATSAAGRIARVNSGDGFVILTYPLGKLPAVGTRLGVYRNGMKVGELKVSEPQYQQNTAADITAGEAQPGDEARDN